MKTNEEIWNEPLPEQLIRRHVTPEKLPKTRGEWAEHIYNWVFVLEESTVGWDKDTIIILDEAILYFGAYGMPALAWWTKRLKHRILFGETTKDEKSRVRLDTNTLRGIFHDEFRDPVGCLHTKNTRENIEEEYGEEM